MGFLQVLCDGFLEGLLVYEVVTARDLVSRNFRPANMVRTETGDAESPRAVVHI